MERDTYTITRSARAWTLKLNGRPIQSFPDPLSAHRAATVASRMSQNRGRSTVVLGSEDISAYTS